MTKEKQIDDMDIAVLQCYRNKYQSEGNGTEQGIIANAINDVLPTLFAVKNGDYCKASDVVEEIFEEIEKHLVTGCTFYGQAIYSIGVDTFVELKKKYTEGRE